MNGTFRPYLRKFVLVFFDGILTYSANQQACVGHPRVILEVLKKHSLRINKQKCSIGMAQLDYLGHIVSAEGIVVDPKQN